MIIKLSDTNTREIAKQLVSVRDSGGQVTTGRVLTLIVVASEDDDLESIIKATHDASREHPSRVLIMVAGDPQGESRVDAEIRFGGDAGASEIILMALHGGHRKHPSTQHKTQSATPRNVASPTHSMIRRQIRSTCAATTTHPAIPICHGPESLNGEASSPPSLMNHLTRRLSTPALLARHSAPALTWLLGGSPTV